MIRPRDFDDSGPRSRGSDAARTRANRCEEVLEQLELVWSDGRLADTLVALAEDAKDERNEVSSDALPSRREPADLLAHLGSCSTCSREAASLESLDRSLRHEFQELAESVSPPPEDEILAILRQPFVDPVTENLRRVSHRSVRTVLWLTFFLLSLLFVSALGTLAYFAYRLAAE